ncbi:MAG: hypothetical protein QM791_22090 [Ferruginibacter sp.]
MKKLIIAFVCVSFLASSCAVFQKKEKLGCGTDGRNVGAEKLLSGDPKAEKAARKAKFRG